MTETYDAIVVGARCAGAPTAMLLARSGHRVLLVDRSTFPSDTVSNAFFNAPTAMYLTHWGLLDRLVAEGTPPIGRTRVVTQRNAHVPMRYDNTVDLPYPLYAPRRTVLDHLLVRGAVEEGVELREGVRVTELTYEGGRAAGIRGAGADGDFTARGRIVVGADGRRSTIARLVGAKTIFEHTVSGGGVICYFEGVPTDAMEFHVIGGVWIGLAPTNDDLTHVGVARLTDDRCPVTGDAEERFSSMINSSTELRDRVRAGKPVSRFVAYRDEPVYWRSARGPGWALVGDASFHQGPFAGLGMAHAFRGAARLAESIGAWLSGRATEEEAMSTYASDQSTHAALFGRNVVANVEAWRRGRQGPSPQPLVDEWMSGLLNTSSV